jgi:hypothetical protein
MSASAPCDDRASRASARATPRRASAPVQQFHTMPLWSRIFWNSAAAAGTLPRSEVGLPADEGVIEAGHVGGELKLAVFDGRQGCAQIVDRHAWVLSL